MGSRGQGAIVNASNQRSCLAEYTRVHPLPTPPVGTFDLVKIDIYDVTIRLSPIVLEAMRRHLRGILLRGVFWFALCFIYEIIHVNCNEL